MRNSKMASKKKTTTKKKPAPKKSPAKKVAPKKAAGKKPAAKKSAGKPAPKKTGGKKAPARKAQRVARRPAVKRAAPKKKVVKAAAPKVKVAPAPEALALAREIAKVAADKKAADVLIIDTRERASAVGYDYLVIASGDSDRQLSAIHEGVDALLKPRNQRAASVELSPDWLCATYDVGVIAHFFTPDRREQMDLEDLWSTAPRVS